MTLDHVSMFEPLKEEPKREEPETNPEPGAAGPDLRGGRTERTKRSFCRRRSSIKERKGNALASGADEGRDKLRKASGSCK